MPPDDFANEYEACGFVVRRLFSDEETRRIAETIIPHSTREQETRVLERDGVTVRSVFAPHVAVPECEALSRSGRILDVVHRLIGPEVYIYQSKYNVKDAFRGDVWEWHQDFMTWEREDGLPRDTLVTAMLFLDDVTTLNAPLLVIPGSHRHGVLDVFEQSEPSSSAMAREDSWLENHAATLKYTIPDATISDLCAQHDIREITGPAGTVCFFHANLVHGSTVNMSPHRRGALFFTYSPVSNVAGGGISERPDFVVGRDNAPLGPVDDQELGAVFAARVRAG